MSANNPAAIAALMDAFPDAFNPDAQIIVDALDDHGMTIVDRSSLCFILGAMQAALWERPVPTVQSILNTMAEQAGITSSLIGGIEDERNVS